jgi:flagellar motor switch/type III secretory pathway protein FliN
VATATVSLRVADRCIAEGTLIAIGNRLGVRIGTVLAQREAGAA